MPIRPLLLGHRGARADKSVSENTIASFDLALAQGCGGFEFDVRLTGNGQAVICHDRRTRGMEIAASSAQRLRLPFLREVLARYQRKAFLDIELKVSGLERICCELLLRIPPARGFVVSSFLPDVLEKLHCLDPRIPLGLICETQSQLGRWFDLPTEYVIVHHKLARPKRVTEMKAAGRKILVWTVNLPADIRRFSRLGVDGIISDNPQRLIRVIREKDARLGVTSRKSGK
jgi:glycerophosphoryl diester phosphodiesterase